MKIKSISALFAFTSIFLVASGTASAAWPGGAWGPTNTVLTVERIFAGYTNPVHYEPDTYFMGYMAGNTTGNGTGFPITLVQTDFCDLANPVATQEIRVLANHPGGQGIRNTCGDLALWMTYSQGVYDITKDRTEYRIHVQLDLAGYLPATNGTDKGYRFQVTGPGGMSFVNQGKDAGGNYRPIVFLPNGPQGQFHTMSISQLTPCPAGGAAIQETISSKDYDNFPTSRAQSTTTTASAGDGVFSAMYVSLNPWGSGNIAADTYSHEGAAGAGWTPIAGNYYQPNDTGTQQLNNITYTFARGTAYDYTLHNLGQNNFVRLDLPFDGGPPCPPAQDADLRATASANDSASLPATKNFALGVVVDFAQRTYDDTYRWTLDRSDNGGLNWYNVSSGRIMYRNGGTSQTPASPSTPGNYCYRISIDELEGYASAVPPSAQQCINVTQPPVYDPYIGKTSGTGGDYEKGGNPVIFEHGVTVTTYPCDLTVATGAWVNSRAWSSTPYVNLGNVPPINGIGPSTPAGSIIEFANCSTGVRINSGAAYPGAAGANIVFDTYSTSADVATLIAATTLPGTNYGRKMFIDGSNDPDNLREITFKVYAAPFTRIRGNDALICGSGANNRFVYDDRTPPIAAGAYPISNIKGSFVSYASMYGSGNNPAGSYSGLNSSAVNANFALGLITNWNTGASCAKYPSDIGSHANQNTVSTADIGNPNTFRRLFYFAGDITINNDIILGNPAFNPETYPVVIIYANGGNINISPGVTRIDAILVAIPNTSTGVGGQVNTCGTTSKGTLHTVCTQKLTVNGAISAKTINFQRAFGSRFLASNVDRNDDTQTAEVINYPWYLHYLALPLPDMSLDKFDAYFSLPPRM